MFFGDNVMLFAEASQANIQNVLSIIELLDQEPRQRINIGKSLIFRSLGIPRQVHNMLLRVNGFQKAIAGFSYMGFLYIKLF